MSKKIRHTAARFVSFRTALGAATCLLVGVAGWTGTVQTQAAPQTPTPRAASASAPALPPTIAEQRALFTRYCATCHSQAMKSRGTVPVAFDTLDIANVAANPETWEKIVLKIRAGVMPPSGSPRPEKATHEAFVSWLESELDKAASANPNPGRTEAFHRLNRTEYRNAVRDLLGVDLDVSSMLPADDSSYGFDNIAGVLRVSPTLMERYLIAAQKISRAAIGTPPPAPSIDFYRVADDLNQDVHLPDMPFGTRGGTRISYLFPLDGEYEIRPRLTRDLNEGMPAYLDGWLAVKGTEKKAEVEAFMNFLLEPENYAGFVNGIGASYVMPAAEEFIDPAITGNPSLAYDPESIKSVEFEAFLGEEATKIRNRVWQEVKNA